MNKNTFTYFATKTTLKREMVICFYFLYFNYNFSVLQSRDLPRDWLLGEGGGRQGGKWTKDRGEGARENSMGINIQTLQCAKAFDLLHLALIKKPCHIIFR